MPSTNESNNKMLTLEILGKYNGENDTPMYVSIKGTIFDVSSKKELFGPGGSYSIFSGKDASYSLAKMSLNPDDTNKFEFTLNEVEQKTLDDWVIYFTKRYPIVGQLKHDRKLQATKDEANRSTRPKL